MTTDVGLPDAEWRGSIWRVTKTCFEHELPKIDQNGGRGRKRNVADQATLQEGLAMSMDGNHEIDLVAEPLFELRVVCCVIRRHDANDVALVKGKRGMVLAGDGPTARTVSEWLSDTALQLVDVECGGPLTTK